MANRKRGYSRRRRVTPSNANRRLPTTVTSPRSLPYQYDLEDLIRSDRLTEIEDRRTYHPEGESRPARSISKRAHRLELAKPVVSQWNELPGYSGIYSPVAFTQPHNVLVCIRRKQRKEVLHALNKAGKAGQKTPRRSAYSDIQC